MHDNAASTTRLSEPEQIELLLEENETLNAANEQLQQQLTRLVAANEQLQTQLAASEQARVAAESRALQLSAIVQADAEDLHQFGANWFRPSSITSITWDTSGIHINGTRMGYATSTYNSPYAEEMRELAQEINTMNAARRRRAEDRTSGS